MIADFFIPNKFIKQFSPSIYSSIFSRRKPLYFTTIWKNLCELAQHHIGMICSHSQFHFLGHLRCDPVIRINKHHQFSTGSTQARISRIR